MSRWIIVSNRLPFSYCSKQKKLIQSSGGLVTAIKGISTRNDVVWVGTTDGNIKPEHITEMNKHKKTQYEGISLKDNLYDSYYNKFSNDVLWPALHYEMDRVKFNEDHYEDYRAVNKIFAKKIASLCKKGDLVWIHDYHLFLCPMYLRELVGDKVKIGFFLHVPFPSSEIYRQLTPRREMLKSLLNSDLIGFHDFSYLRHFSRTVYDILGHTTKQMEIKSGESSTKLGVFPVSIPSKKILNKSKSSSVQKMKDELFPKTKNSMQYILGVDRLDYTKGIPQKLAAFEKFLTDNPKFIGKVQLIQIAVPTRTTVDEYIELRRTVEGKVGEINGKFGKLNYLPVNYINKSINMNELLALYQKADVLFVSSLRDGMNLVCLEYVMSQSLGSPGVVLLSEFAGAMATLSHAISINPHNLNGTAKKIQQALVMEQSERKSRIGVMKDYLLNYNSSHWANDFMSVLSNFKQLETNQIINLEDKNHSKKLKSILNKKQKVIFLDFDGTLSAIVSNPDDATITKKVYKTLMSLSNDPEIELVIVSGRQEDFLRKRLEGIACHMAFEHGAMFFDRHQQKVRNLVSTSRAKWYNQAIKIIESYKDRTPNSFIEKKNFAIAWHFRNSPSDFGEFQARNLVADLRGCFQGLPVSVILGKKVVEIKSSEANKGRFLEWFLERYSSNNKTVLVAGDDRTDEDMFDAVTGHGISIKVGSDNKTAAKFFIESQKKFESKLEELLL